MHKMYKSIICVCFMLMLSSCSFFQIRKPIIVQGNIIDQKAVSQLHTGMSPAQVVSVMGSPVLANILDPNRIAYVYFYDNGRRRQNERVILIFVHGRLQSIQHE